MIVLDPAVWGVTILLKVLEIVTSKQKQASTPTILLEGTPLECVDTFKYLGVILSWDPSWTPQVESICTKLFRLLYRCFHNDWDNYPSWTIYMHHTTQTSLGICSPCLGSSTSNNISKLEDTQWIALRICTLKCVHFILSYHCFHTRAHRTGASPAWCAPDSYLNTILLYLHPYFTNLLHKPMQCILFIFCPLRCIFFMEQFNSRSPCCWLKFPNLNRWFILKRRSF